ncbi:MAG: hypothetical protein BWY82_01811 [Verrucomicrobia bacterium ADurb.Bin474]|nr:MAG: hypothetical protein BWY82_01811 [Verrucomicrobia bacterium ADurb.Bin474]
MPESGNAQPLNENLGCVCAILWVPGVEGCEDDDVVGDPAGAGEDLQHPFKCVILKLLNGAPEHRKPGLPGYGIRNQNRHVSQEFGLLCRLDEQIFPCELNLGK